MKLSIFRLAGLTLIGLLMACGTQTQAPNTLTQADAQVLSEAVQGDLQLTGFLLSNASVGALTAQSEADSLDASAQSWGLPRRLNVIMRAVGVLYLPARGGANCDIRTTPSPLVDADNDGVPATATTTFDCRYTSPGGISYTLSGAITLQDTNDNQPNSGFSVSFDNFRSVVSGPNRSVERTLNGYFSIDTQNPALFTIAKNYTQTVARTVRNHSFTGSLAFNLSKTYAPTSDGDANPWNAGTITVARTDPGSATWTRGSRTRNLIWYTDPTLHWNHSYCRKQEPLMNFDRGALEYVYTSPAGDKSTLRIEFTGCGQFTVTLNGQPVD
jgi:hypothetical protein